MLESLAEMLKTSRFLIEERPANRGEAEPRPPANSLSTFAPGRYDLLAAAVTASEE